MAGGETAAAGDLILALERVLQVAYSIIDVSCIPSLEWAPRYHNTF